MKKTSINRQPGFSLVEIVVSIGVIAFMATVIVYSLITASKSGNESVRKGQSIQLLNSVIEDYRSARLNGFSRSSRYRIDTPSKDGAGESLTTLLFDVDGGLTTEDGRASFRCYLTVNRDDDHSDLVHIHARMAWPARASEGKEPYQTELLSSLLLP